MRVAAITSGAVKLLENDEFFLLKIKSHQAAKKYGKGTKWIISNSGGDSAFADYMNGGASVFFLIRKNAKDSDRSGKIGILIQDNKKTIFDSDNNPIDSVDLPFEVPYSVQKIIKENSSKL